MKHSSRGVVLAMSICLTACALTDANRPGTSSLGGGSSPYRDGTLGALTYRAVDLVLSQASDIKPDTPMLVASITDTQNVEATTALGNIVADMVRTRIAQDGYTASEFRLRSAINFKNGDGEFLLSRNRRALLAAPNAAAIVTGTYAASFEQVFVSLKLVSATDTHIIAAADFVVPRKEIEGLLRYDKI